MSWPTKITAASSSCCRRNKVSITRFCTTTSKALVGSSAMITSGRKATAMAMPMRCFMPPLSSWGYMRAVAGSSSTRASRLFTRSCRAVRSGLSSCAAIVSAICAPTRITGLSEFITPWGIREMREKRTSRSSSSDSASNSSSPRLIRPASIRPGGRISRIRAKAVVDLPEPDSPAKPSRSPERNSNSTPSTARTGPLGVW